MSFWTTDAEKGTINCEFEPECPICINRPDHRKIKLSVWLVKFLEFPIGDSIAYALDIVMKCPECQSINYFGVPQHEKEWRLLKEKYYGKELAENK